MESHTGLQGESGAGRAERRTDAGGVGPAIRVELAILAMAAAYNARVPTAAACIGYHLRR